MTEKEKLLCHVDNTMQTLPFSHEIESFVDIFKWQVMCYVLVDLDFLQVDFLEFKQAVHFILWIEKYNK